jgi:hypothetical protein
MSTTRLRRSLGRPGIGEAEFLERAARLVAEHVEDGVPLRGEIELFGYVGTKI